MPKKNTIYIKTSWLMQNFSQTSLQEDSLCMQTKSKTIKFYSGYCLNLMKFLYTENQKDGQA